MSNLPAAALDSLDADELLMLGLRAASEGRSESLGLYKLALQRNPDHAKAHWALATEYASLRMPDRAREHFARAVELDPSQPVARFQYGLLCLTQGNVTEAETLWAPLDNLAPNDPVRLFKQGLLEMVADRFDSALSLIRTAMASPGLDAALQRDMTMIVQRIEEARAAPQTAANEADRREQEQPIESHLALSAYRSGGSTH